MANGIRVEGFFFLFCEAGFILIEITRRLGRRIEDTYWFNGCCRMTYWFNGCCRMLKEIDDAQTRLK